MAKTTEITALREASLTARANQEVGSTYIMQIKQLEDLHAGMVNAREAIHKDGTLTKDGKIYETGEYMRVFQDKANSLIERIQHEVDSRIHHFDNLLFTNNPTLSDVEKAMIPMISEMALKEPTKAMEVRSRANIVNALLHMGLYSKAQAKTVYEGLNSRYSRDISENLGLWHQRNDNLQEIKSGLKQYITTNNYTKAQIDRVNANKVAGAGNRHKRVS